MKRNIWNNLLKQYQEQSTVEFQPKSPRGSANPITSFGVKIPSEEYLKYIQSFELETIYALDLMLNLTIRDAVRFIVSYPISVAKKSIAKRIESYVLKMVSECINWNTLIEELSIQGQAYKKTKTISITSEMEKVSELQYAAQYFIENNKIGWREKAEAFLHSHLYADLEYLDNEALIYMLTRTQKPELLADAISAYSDPLSSPNSLDVDLVWQIKDHLIGLEDRLLKVIEYQAKHTRSLTEYKYDKGEYIEHPDIFRYLNIKSIQYLMTFIAQIPESTRNRLLPDQVPDFSKPFSFLKCSAAIQLHKQKLERLLWDIHYVLDEYGSELPEYIINEKAATPMLLALYVFGCYRTGSDLLKEKTLHRAVRYLKNLETPILPEKMPTTVPPFKGVSAAAMYIYAMAFADTKEINNTILSFKKWLVNNQSAYGDWYDWGDNPLFTTVLVMDALSINDDKVLSFPIKIKQLREKSEVSLQPIEISQEDQIIICQGNKIHIGGIENWELLMALIDRNGSPLKHEEIAKMTDRQVNEVPTRIGELKKLLNNCNGRALAKAIKNQRTVGYYFDQSAL